MNGMNRILITAFLASLSYTGIASAAQQVSSPAGKVKIGVVSVSHLLTVDEVEHALNSKADAAGATSYRIIAVGGQNRMFGVADIYK